LNYVNAAKINITKPKTKKLNEKLLKTNIFCIFAMVNMYSYDRKER